VQAGAPAPFEVHCERCRVTFPVGTRRCIHCGSPTSRATRRHELRVEPARESEMEASEAPDPELARRRFVSPLTLVWIALIAAGYLVRACSGQAP
jgi:ribosomal protein L37E